MTLKEFNDLIEEQRNNGLSDEDIFKVFAGMFVEGDLERDALIAIGKHLGFEITEEASKMSDDELRQVVFEEKEEEEVSPPPQENLYDWEKDPAMAEALLKFSREKRSKKKKEQLINFLSSIYIPGAKREEVKILLDRIQNETLGGIDKSYEHKTNVRFLLIETKGVASRETYLRHAFVDGMVGQVGKTFFDIAYAENNKANILRLGVKSPKFAIVLDGD